MKKIEKMKKFEQYINGEFSSGGEYFESVNPANGQVWAKFPAASEEETKLAIESAHKALFEGDGLVIQRHSGGNYCTNWEI